jgi:hypothetical protein
MSNDPVSVPAPNNSGNTWTFIPATNPTYTTLPGGIVYTISIGNTIVPINGDVTGPAPVAIKKKDKAGCSCKKCKEFADMAEPNQDDGTFICWSCRHGY